VQIPVERTIGDTYRFAFTNILSIFGIAWLPTLIIAAAIGGAVWSFLPVFHTIDWSSTPDMAHNQAVFAQVYGKLILSVFVLEFLFYVMFAMIWVGIQRKALGLIEGPVLVYFSLGGAVWRLLGAMIAVMFLLLLLGGATFAAVSLVYWFGTHYALPVIYGLVEFVATVAGICWVIYAMVRLTFFVSPALVAEGGFGIARSWELGRENFWRIVVLFLACVFGPMIVISMVSNIVLMPYMAGPMMQIQQAALSHRVMPPEQVFSMFAQIFQHVLPLLIAYEVVTFPILIGLQSAVSVFAYRNITQSEVPA
jgi:hypothetical protein